MPNLFYFEYIGGDPLPHQLTAWNDDALIFVCVIHKISALNLNIFMCLGKLVI